MCLWIQCCLFGDLDPRELNDISISVFKKNILDDMFGDDEFQFQKMLGVFVCSVIGQTMFLGSFEVGTQLE